MKIIKRKSYGFTILEISLAVVSIILLVSIAILAIKQSSKQRGYARNAQRENDIKTILNATYRYALDNDGILPMAIPTAADCILAAEEICKTGGSCNGLTDLSVLTADQKYLVIIPTDPQKIRENGTGYHIVKNTNGRVTVCAPFAEGSTTISVAL